MDNQSVTTLKQAIERTISELDDLAKDRGGRTHPGDAVTYARQDAYRLTIERLTRILEETASE